MKNKLAIMLLGIFCSLPSMALERAQQREIYQKINEIINISNSEPTLQLAQQMLRQIEDYPLYPYAQYRLLKSQIAQLDWQQIETYQQNNADLPLSQALAQEWLKQQQLQQNWQAIVQHQAKLPTDQASQCIIWQAQSATKLDQKSTALLPQTELQQLWLNVANLPTPCAALIEQWHQQGGISPQLAQQRAIWLLQQGNLAALVSLKRQLTDPINQQWIEDLIQLLKAPNQLAQTDQPFSLAQMDPQNPQHQQIVLAIMPLYIKALKDIADPLAEFNKIDTWAQQWQISAQQQAEWKKIYLAQFFDIENPQFAQWRDQQLATLQDDKLTERRIRMAIREKQDIKSWLNLLSESAKQKEEWQYWLAQQLPAAEKQQKLTALSTKRSFFGVLAAQQLGLPYQPEMDSLTQDSNATPIEQSFANGLARVREWRAFDDQTQQYKEWQNLLQQTDFKQKLQLADYAIQQHWYDLAVEATIQAKAWSYLSLRLPNAYMDWFDLHLNGKQIQRSFAMAIARQESAWKPEAISRADARGLMQLLPSTAKQTAQKAQLPYQHDGQLLDPFYNIMLGTAHLQQLADKYDNNRILIAAAYNAGANRVDKWLAQSNGKLSMAEFVSAIPYFETRGYVQNVLAYDAYYQILQQQPQHLFFQNEQNRLY